MPRVGYVVNGVYHRGAPNLPEMIIPQQSTYREWDHDKQRQEHGADIVQPHKNGKPNQEFIDLYPEASVDYGFLPPPEIPDKERYGN
jgi:hypothetical protein